MTKRFIHVVAFMVAIVSGISSAQANDPWALESEALFLKLYTAHGASQEGVFGFDPSMRHAVSYTCSNNIGARVSYFDYDHEGTFTAPGGPRLISLQIENIDLEIYKRVNLTELTKIEISAGIRHSDNEVFFPTRFEPNDFTGIGGIVGLRASTKVGILGELYMRGKMGLLGGEGMHDGNGINTPLRYQQSRTHLELAFGFRHTFEFERWSITPHIGGEWINLSDYAVDPVDEQPESDMMLGGITTGLVVTF